MPNYLLIRLAIFGIIVPSCHYGLFLPIRRPTGPQEGVGSLEESVTRPPSTRPPSGSPPGYFSIVGAILAVAPFILFGLIDSIADALALLAVAVTLAAVLYLAIPLWPQKATRWFVLSVAIFFLIFSAFSWLLFVNGNNGDSSALRKRVAQLEQDLAIVKRQETARTALTAFVGKGTAKSCESLLDNSLFFEGELASLDCYPDGEVNFSMAMYPDARMLEEDYSNVVRDQIIAKGISTNTVGNCQNNKPGEGEWQYKNDASSRTVGRLVCFVNSSGSAEMHWTYNEQKIQVLGLGSGDSSIGALYKWWERLWSVKP